MTAQIQMGILPSLFIALGGLLVLRSADEEAAAQQRLLHYWLVVSGVLLAALFVAIRLTAQRNNMLFGQVANILIPALIGVVALVLLSRKELLAMGRRVRLVALWLMVLLAAMVIVYWGSQFELGFRILPGLVILLLGWSLGRRFPQIAILLSLWLLAALLLFLNVSFDHLSSPPIWFRIFFLILILAAPGLSVMLPAVLLTDGLQKERGKGRLLLVALALVLLGFLAYTVFWGSIWDQTDDGLWGISMSRSAGVVAMGAGMVMAMALTGRQRVAGLLFTILVPLLLFQSFEQGWSVSYHDLTENRAQRIATALEDYHLREGVYPPTLAALTPRDLLWLPRPVVLQGETWCYQGGADFYRLGTFSREFFSMPVELVVFSTEGEPDSEWACADRLAEMKERYYSPLEDPAGMQPPLPTPLPPNEFAREGEVLAPLLGEGDLVWGSWSPDSAYFLLGQREDAGRVAFFFLNGQTGELCSAPGVYSLPPAAVNLRAYHAWLPEGKLLLLDDRGQLTMLEPCTMEVQTITTETKAQLTEMMAGDTERGRVLIKSAGEFWIFDGMTQSWQPIPEVTPNPYAAHWDNAAWQSGGERLVISRLNGRDAGEGSTLYLIDGATGEALTSVSLDAATDQSAPYVEWLAGRELLLGSSGVLQILDLGTDPPQAPDIMADIFGLDLDFPGEVWGHGWVVDEANGHYYLTLRANHPRNQALYIYHSATGTVEEYADDAQILLLLPDGELEQWNLPEDEPLYRDEFLWLDLAEGAISGPLVIEGHTPRDYPQLSMAYLATTDQLVVASSQGVSLHNRPDGEMIRFWRLGGQGFAPHLLPSPDGSAVVAVRDQGGIYWIPWPLP